MQGLSSEFQQSWKTVNAVLDGGAAMTTYDMLKLQMGLTQMSIQYDLVGKAISRSTQNLDQLVKMQ
jgi:type III secretion protein I